MAYVDNYTLTTVYWKNYADKYMEAYNHFFNEMKDRYEDEQALAAAVATAMIAFSKASGMDMAGVVTWDENLAENPTDFTTFAKVKVVGTQSSSSGGYAPKGGYQKPGSSGGFGKPYTGPTELKGPASEKQVNKIHEFLNDQDAKVQKAVTEALAALDAASPEELSKQDASNVLQAGFDAKKKGGYSKK
jgi:hypothetical protein